MGVSAPAHRLQSQQRPGLWPHPSWWPVTHLPGATELLNCIDGGAVAKASFVRAVWSQPCLAERYIHYADSSDRDFQRDGPRREADRHAPFPGLSGPLVPRLIDMRAHSVKGAVLNASQISARNSPVRTVVCEDGYCAHPHLVDAP